MNDWYFQTSAYKHFWMPLVDNECIYRKAQYTALVQNFSSNNSYIQPKITITNDGSAAFSAWINLLQADALFVILISLICPSV